MMHGHGSEHALAYERTLVWRDAVCIVVELKRAARCFTGQRKYTNANRLRACTAARLGSDRDARGLKSTDGVFEHRVKGNHRVIYTIGDVRIICCERGTLLMVRWRRRWPIVNSKAAR